MPQLLSWGLRQAFTYFWGLLYALFLVVIISVQRLHCRETVLDHGGGQHAQWWISMSRWQTWLPWCLPMPYQLQEQLEACLVDFAGLSHKTRRSLPQRLSAPCICPCLHRASLPPSIPLTISFSVSLPSCHVSPSPRQRCSCHEARVEASFLKHTGRRNMSVMMMAGGISGFMVSRMLNQLLDDMCPC